MSDRPRALAVLIAVFLLGGVVGSAGFYYWFEKPGNTLVERGRNGPPQMPDRQPLPVRLHLSPDQEARFREIMSEARNQMESLRTEREKSWEALRAKQSPEIEKIFADVNSKITAFLDDEQKKEYDVFLKEMETMRKHPPRGRGFEPGDRGNPRPPR